MRYCPTCDSEFSNDAPAVCPDDGATLLDREAWEAQRAREGRLPRVIGRLVVVAELADRFQAQELTGALVEEGIEALLSSDKSGTMSSITTPGPTLYRIGVAQAEAERAAALIAEWRAGLESPEAEERAEAAATTESVSSP